VNQKFEENGHVLAKISDTYLIVHKGTQQYEYRLDSLTAVRPVYSHETEPEHVVVFNTNDAPGQTIGIVWSIREKAEKFRNAITSAIIDP
jgi:hypothetical protein